MDNVTFRGQFPEFSDIIKYSDAALTFWISVASAYVDPNKWQTLTDTGTSLALAHFLVLAARNQTGNPGQGTGLANSQSAGDVSVGYDTGSTTEEKGGMWNLTNYGQQYLRMARLIGGVAVQVPASLPSDGSAWPQSLM